jgi:NADH:ubiquinone reductase (H+-translocating)
MALSINIPTTSRPRIVIIGGGFAGIELAKRLRSLDVQVVLFDKNNYHTFQPLLYQVATAALEPDSIAYPFREIFHRQGNCLFRMAEVTRIRPETNSIETSIGELSYEYLVVAVGSETNYFGMKDMAEKSLPMKSIPQAMALRNMILQNFEKALLTADLEEREALMNIAVCGGGPTGVEMAGSLGELKRHVLPHDYPELDFDRMQIHIIDMGNRLLNAMSPEASASAEKFLKKFSVNLWLNTKVTSYDGQRLALSNGKTLLAENVIWAAGVTGSLIPGLKTEAIAPGNRVRVDRFNKVTGYENIFAIGDIAGMIDEKTPKGHPMLAPVAIQQAHLLAKNLARLFKKHALTPFEYKELGVMATVGRNNAVADFKFMKIQGFFGWVVWLFVHLMALVGFRNKMVAFVNWAWSYFSYDKGLRLIIQPFSRSRF